MAWIAVVPPSPRHPYERYQVCYREGTRQRSAGVFPTKRRAEAERRAIERGRTELTGATGIDLEQKARTLFGEYVATKWWPAWKDQHPTSEYGTRKKVEKPLKDLVTLTGVFAAGSTAIPLILTALAVFFLSLISLAMPASGREHALMVLDRLTAFADVIRGHPTAALDETSTRGAEPAAGSGQQPSRRNRAGPAG